MEYQNKELYRKIITGLRKMESLDLNNEKNGNEDAKNLAKVFEDSGITKLDLTFNPIWNELMKYLVEVLKFSQINHLDLRVNEIGERGVKYLAEALGKTQIINLTLNHNSIGDEGTKYLSENLKYSRIIVLNLICVSMKDEGIKYLSQALVNTQITNLDLRENSIGDEGTKYLGENLKYSQITTLHLECVSMGDEGIKHLAEGLKESKVQVLILSKNRISDDGVKSLAQVLEYTQITELNLDENRIGIDGAEYIKGISEKTKIKKLSMWIGLTENENHRYIIEYTLDNDRKEVDMTLKSNDIGTNGARFINRTSQNIVISDLTVSDISNLNQAQYLAEAFNNIKIMRLYSLPMMDADVEPSIQAFKNSRIAELIPRFEELGPTDRTNLAAFLSEVNIIDLNFSGNYLGDWGVENLVWILKNKSIMSLKLSSNNISDEGVKYLVEVLRNIHITRLDLSENEITDKGVKYLADGLIHSQVRYIDLRKNQIENTGYQYLKNIIENTFLTEVKCDHNDLDGFLSSNQQYSILENTNVTLADEITPLFESIVTLNPVSNQFEFNRNKKDSSPSKTMEEYILLIETLNDNPILKVHIVDQICRRKKDYFDFVMMDKINDFMKSVPDLYNTFFDSE